MQLVDSAGRAVHPAYGELWGGSRTSPWWPREPDRSSASRSHASAVRLVNQPDGGRPRSVHAGPSFLWTWRPSGNRYLAYHTGPRTRSTRNTWPVGTPAERTSRDLLGTWLRSGRTT
jgi:hypothetical protein